MKSRWSWLLIPLGMGGVIYLLAPILTPFVVGALLAYLADPVADRLERWKLSRTAAVSVVFVGLALILSVVLLILIPALERQVSQFLSDLPRYLAWIRNSLIPWLESRLQVNIAEYDPADVIELLKRDWQRAGGIAASVAGSISRSGAAIIGWLINVLLVPVVMFYLLRDWDRLMSNIADLIPRAKLPVVARLARESDEVLSAFLRGQLSVMLALGSIYSMGLWAVGLNTALVIGMIAGLISFIPYLGTFVGVILGVLAALVQFQDVWHVILVLLVFWAGQILEGMVLTPLLVGDKIGLHPVMVIFAVMAGGHLFGFLGVLLALPVASVVMVLVRHIYDLYKDSAFYDDVEKPM
ncbi:MAG: AI-2E family transporter [Methylothermaceae bacterium]|nr:AI-2E family transporter [Methylothermaceae bacterium]